MPMRKILRNMGLQITEISEIMGVSRPTMYKFIEMYEDGDKEKIDSNVLKFLENVERNPKMQRKDALYYALLIQNGRDGLNPREGGVKPIVTVTMMERPARKLILLRSRNAMDYLSYCEEMGCDWEGIMNDIECRCDDAAIVFLPKSMVAPNTSRTASGVEVPPDFSVNIPAGYETIEIPPCTMLCFRGLPYDTEECFCEAIDIVSDALNTYDPEPYGWKFDYEAAPTFNFGASAKKGARMAAPIKKL